MLIRALHFWGWHWHGLKQFGAAQAGVCLFARHCRSTVVYAGLPAGSYKGRRNIIDPLVLKWRQEDESKA